MSHWSRVVHIDIYLVLGSAVVGLLVGLTGMGGGALMTPMLVLLFGVTPSAAITSDLMAALFMKPSGVAIHWRAQDRQQPTSCATSVTDRCRRPSSGPTSCTCSARARPRRHRLEILLGTALDHRFARDLLSLDLRRGAPQGCRPRAGATTADDRHWRGGRLHGRPHVGRRRFTDPRPLGDGLPDTLATNNWSGPTWPSHSP